MSNLHQELESIKIYIDDQANYDPLVLQGSLVTILNHLITNKNYIDVTATETQSIRIAVNACAVKLLLHQNCPTTNSEILNCMAFFLSETTMQILHMESYINSLAFLSINEANQDVTVTLGVQFYKAVFPILQKQKIQIDSDITRHTLNSIAETYRTWGETNCAMLFMRLLSYFFTANASASDRFDIRNTYEIYLRLGAIANIPQNIDRETQKIQFGKLINKLYYSFKNKTFATYKTDCISLLRLAAEITYNQADAEWHNVRHTEMRYLMNMLPATNMYSCVIWTASKLILDADFCARHMEKYVGFIEEFIFGHPRNRNVEVGLDLIEFMNRKLANYVVPEYTSEPFKKTVVALQKLHAKLVDYVKSERGSPKMVHKMSEALEMFEEVAMSSFKQNFSLNLIKPVINMEIDSEKLQLTSRSSRLRK